MSTGAPDFFEIMLKNQYGAEIAAQIIDGSRRKRPVTLRANTLKTDITSVKAQLAEAGIACQEVPWYQDALILPEARESSVQSLGLYTRGEIYLQSLSSMIPPLLLNPRERESILDMTAAPGGKTTQMAALSGNRAQITACEKNKIRAERLKYNLEKQGAARVSVMLEDARKLDPLFSFDKILLDAPCSGTLFLGTSSENREPAGYAEANSIERYFNQELIRRSISTQEALLRKALELLKPGHEMIYSTCSVLESENELLLQRILPKMKAQIVPIEHPMMTYLPLLPTRIPGVCCVCPTAYYEGFFVARIRKKH